MCFLQAKQTCDKYHKGKGTEDHAACQCKTKLNVKETGLTGLSLNIIGDGPTCQKDY